MAPTTQGTRPVSSSTGRRTRGLRSPGFSRGSSTAPNPRPATWRSRSGTEASVRGEVHTQVLTPRSRMSVAFLAGRRGGGCGPGGGPPGPRGSRDLAVLPDLRVARQVLATELRVVTVGHALV